MAGNFTPDNEGHSPAPPESTETIMYTICSLFAICSFGVRVTYIPLEQVRELGYDMKDHAIRHSFNYDSNSP